MCNYSGKLSVWAHCCSVTKSLLTLCDPMDCSMSGFSVRHYLSEFAQTHVHWVSDAIQSSSVTPFSSCPQSFWASRSFPMNWLLIKGPYKYRLHLFLLSMNSPMVQSGQRNLFIPFLGCCWHWPCLWKNVVVIDILSKVELIKQGFRHQNYMLNLTWILAEGCWTSCLTSECFPLIFKLRMLLLMLLPKSSWCCEQPIKYERPCACQLFFL